MDFIYATITVFGGEHRILCREAQLAYIISDEEDPTNHPIFALDTDFGSSLLQLTDSPEPPLKIRKSISLFEYPLQLPLFVKCSLMELILEKVLVLE
jgi:hypothetical protein